MDELFMGNKFGNIGGGGGIAPGNGFNEVNFQGFLNKKIGTSFEESQKTFVALGAYAMAKFFDGMQGSAQALSIQSAFAGQKLMPPVSLTSSARIPSPISARG